MTDETSSSEAIDESTIFETPLLELDVDVPGIVYEKAEWYNLYDAAYGGGSIKSRIARGYSTAQEPAATSSPERRSSGRPRATRAARSLA